MSDNNQVFQDENDQRQRMDWQDQQQEMMSAQENADRCVLDRVRRGETDYGDFLCLVGRLNLNLNDLEK